MLAFFESSIIVCQPDGDISNITAVMTSTFLTGCTVGKTERLHFTPQAHTSTMLQKRQPAELVPFQGLRLRGENIAMKTL